MSVGRYWRTARHLSRGQVVGRLERGVRHFRWARSPDTAWQRIEARAAQLPRPDVRAAPLARAAEHVRLLNSTLQGDMAKGRFTLLGREFDFGSPEAIDWRGDFAEGDNPLRRMTLAYLGHIFRTEDIALVERMVLSLERGNPFGTPGVMRDVWNPYAASHRLINLLSWMALRRRPDATLNAHARLCAALVLGDLERDLGFNHLLKNFVALAMYGIPLDPRQVARIVGDCVLADGGHAERSPMYHVLGLLDLRVLRELGYDVADATLRMERALSVMSHPDGDIALFNDSWIGGAPRAADVAPIFHDMRDLPDTGYVKLASGDDAVIFDCGAAGPDRNPAHAHADFLSIELSVGGKRVIVDPGVATYTAGPERQECRSAAAHNGPVVVGREPLELWGSFRVGRRESARPIDDPAFGGVAPLWCAGALSAPKVARWVGLFPGEGLLVCDVGERSRFLLAADMPAQAVIGTLDRASGRRWSRYGIEEQATAITVTADAGRAATWFGWGPRHPPEPATLERIFDALRNGS